MWSSQQCSSIGDISQGKIAGAAVSPPAYVLEMCLPFWQSFWYLPNHLSMPVSQWYRIALHVISCIGCLVWFMNYLNCREPLVPLIVKSVKNPRSAVCKTALMTCSDIFKAYGDLIVDSIDPLVGIAIQIFYLEVFVSTTNSLNTSFIFIIKCVHS